MYQSKAARSTEIASRVLDILNDSGKYICAEGSGATTFTLPLNQQGNDVYFMISNLVAQNMIINKVAGVTLIALNNLNANTLTFSTASQIIGAGVMIKSVPGKINTYIAHQIGGATMTVA